MSEVSISVDARLVKASGIGTYLSHILPLVVEACQTCRFDIIGAETELKGLPWTDRENVTVREGNSRPYSIREQWEMLKLLDGHSRSLWVPHFNIPLLTKRKLVVTVHDVFHLAMPQFVSGWQKKRYARLMFDAIRRKADAVICVSQFTADEMVRLTGIDRSRLRVIYNGVDQSWSQLGETQTPHERAYVIYVGNVKPHKNLPRLIRAFGKLTKSIPHNLVIVGQRSGFITGDEEAGKEADKLGDRVHFTGWIEEPLLKRYVAHADALILPSLYEGFGLPPLEAMACGCPCAVSNTASLPEVCGDAALYFDPYDVDDMSAKIAQIVSDVDLRQRLIDAGRTQSRKFDWATAASQVRNILEEAAG